MDEELIKLKKNWQQWWFEDVLGLNMFMFYMILLHALMFSLVFINMQISLFIYLTTGRKACV